MAAGRRILIAGIANAWGTALAQQLERRDDVEAVIGIDTRPPPVHLERTEILEADLRSPVLARLVPSVEADTLVHTGILWYPAPGKPARALHDINVIGTLQLLAACERSPTIERVVVRGSAAIYGCEPAGPSFFTEEMARRFPLRTRFQRDIGELEGYFENFARRHSHLTCCMLRYQPELDPESQAPLAGYLSLPAVPTQLGFDPRLQILHSEDAAAALLTATMNPVRGAVNVAPSGSISLSRILRILGRPQLPLPHPLFAPAMSRIGSRLGVGPLYGDAVRWLRFGRGVDNTRMRTDLGFEPRYDVTAAIEDFARHQQRRRLAPAPGIASILEGLGGAR
jgi:UDP-glucose 4-epimerase